MRQHAAGQRHGQGMQGVRAHHRAGQGCQQTQDGPQVDQKLTDEAERRQPGGHCQANGVTHDSHQTQVDEKQHTGRAQAHHPAQAMRLSRPCRCLLRLTNTQPQRQHHQDDSEH